MTIKTRRYRLPKDRYFQLAFGQLLRTQWWVSVLLLGGAAWTAYYYRSWWALAPALAWLLYMAFWSLQFYGVMTLEQNQFIFEPMAYELSSQRILMQLGSKQGAGIEWKQVVRAQARKDAFLLVLSKAQFLYLPHKIFKSPHEVQWMHALLKRKGFVR